MIKETTNPLQWKEKTAIHCNATDSGFGGAEGSRTPVRKRIHRNFSERRRSITFPHPSVGRHTQGIGRVIMRGTVNSFRTHGHHSCHAQTRLVVLPGRTAALSSGENYVIVVL